MKHERTARCCGGSRHAHTYRFHVDYIVIGMWAVARLARTRCAWCAGPKLCYRRLAKNLSRLLCIRCVSHHCHRFSSGLPARGVPCTGYSLQGSFDLEIATPFRDFIGYFILWNIYNCAIYWLYICSIVIHLEFAFRIEHV